MQKDLNQYTTDVVLRSSDQQLFYSWKTFLSISSPVFSAMFTLPQPETSNNDDDDRPVIDLAEDSCTLGHILSLCHPSSCTGKQFRAGSVSELGAVLEATTKYDMESLRCVALKQLTDPSLLRENPVGIYALACQHECHEPARLAAKHTLALPMLVRGYVPELEKIHAGKLCRLLLYREACVTVARSLAGDHTWIVHTYSFECGDGDDEDVGWTKFSNPPSRKYPSGRVEVKSVHMWWFEYMAKSGYALQKTPHGDAVKDKELVNHVLSAISSSKCKRCKELQVWEAFRSFVDRFAEEVERRVAEVRPL
ncbi:hypothetical protein J3R83DRAFT_6351 [Lanmaoa asiatica]|nr:hypothetical protein J3R83DRAFT_6351 [Lanmaoa asiatica]